MTSQRMGVQPGRHAGGRAWRCCWLCCFLLLARCSAGASATAHHHSAATLTSAAHIQPGFAAAPFWHGPDVQPWHEYRPIQWNNRQLERMRRRALLQAGNLLPGAPVCEVGLSYRLLDVPADSGNISGIITLQNNRELDLSRWQIVYRYQSQGQMVLQGVEGAIALTMGTAAGQPARIVDSWEVDSITAGGGTYSFFERSQWLADSKPQSNQSLGITNVNVNGLLCSPASQPSEIEYEACQATLAAGYAPGGADGGGSACLQTFCCGVVLLSSGPPPPPVQFTEPPAPPAPQLPTPVPLPSAPTPSATPGQLVEIDSSNVSSGGLSVVVPIAVSSGVGAAILIIGVWLLARRRRRAHRQQQQQQQQQQLGQLSQESFGRKGWPPAKGEPGILSLSLSAALGPALPPGCTVTFARTLGADGGAVSGADSSLAAGSSVPVPEHQLVSKLVLHEKLGSGAFGVVYRASWEGRQVAVKVLQTACTQGSRELKSFRQEVAILSQLSHPRIVRFLAASTVPPHIFIIEELAEGGSLHQRLHGGGPNSQKRSRRRRHQPLLYPELLQVAADVAEAMCFLHPRVVHRDLKPQNVLLDIQGRALVTDFGISKFKSSTLVSTANNQAGTPAYMAPELFDNGSSTEKVDVFSFAVLLWEAHTAQIPWREVASPMQIVYCVGCQGERLPIPPSCPPFLRRLIEDCWQQEPNQRPPFTAVLERIRQEQRHVAAAMGTKAQTTAGLTGGSISSGTTVSSSTASSSAGLLPLPHAALLAQLPHPAPLDSPFFGQQAAFSSNSTGPGGAAGK